MPQAAAHSPESVVDVIRSYIYWPIFLNEILHNGELILVPGENHAWTVNPSYPVQLVSGWLVQRLIGSKDA